MTKDFEDINLKSHTKVAPGDESIVQTVCYEIKAEVNNFSKEIHLVNLHSNSELKKLEKAVKKFPGIFFIAS